MTGFRDNKQLGLWLNGILVDSFAGAGGASTGLEGAFGRPVDIAINHDPIALSVHRANHPHTVHYTESVFDVNPKEATKGQSVKAAWFSPDCRHFSVAKGGQPVDKKIRGLAWVALKWAVTVKPEIIFLENVKEFQKWGPIKVSKTYKCEVTAKIIREYKPDKTRERETFNLFIKKLERAGYTVDHRVLKAHEYGVPTSRERFFMVARRDGKPVSWPKKTHASKSCVVSGLKKFRTAGECIDWDIPCPSIFDRKRPLVDNTCMRIAAGIQKEILDNPKPFIVEIAHYSKNGRPRIHSLDDPMKTITSSPKGGAFALCVPFIDRAFKTGVASPVDEPLKTIMSGGGGGKNQLVQVFLEKYLGSSDIQMIKAKQCAAFMIQYYGTSTCSSLDKPLSTVTTKDKLALINISSEDHVICDIGFRMLTPAELYKAQGFPEDYIYQLDADGKKTTKTKQVAMVGNSVPPPLAKAVVMANLEQDYKMAQA